jgi:solute carrier family 50 (sugar transporter)
VQIPNGCGSLLGFAQLILYAIYRNHKGKGADAAAEVEDAKKAAAAEVELADAKTKEASQV